MKKDQFLNNKILWNEIEIERGTDLFIYEANFEKQKLLLRLNDFPDEPLYTLFVNNVPICDLDDFPETWKKNTTN